MTQIEATPSGEVPEAQSDSLSEACRKRNLSPSRAGSMTVASAKTRKTSAKESTSSPAEPLNYQRHIQALDLAQMLGTGKWGNFTWQATRCLQALQNSDESSEECVTLMGHLTMAEECLKVKADKLPSVKKEEREKSLALVMPHVVVSELPHSFTTTLLCKIVKENPLATQKDLDWWLESVSPVRGLQRPVSPLLLHV